MKISNNGGGSYCVGSGEEPGKLLLHLKPGLNEVDGAAWEKCKDRPAVKAAVRSSRLVVGGNVGEPPAKSSIIMNENRQRAGRPVKTTHEVMSDAAKQEKADYAAHPTLAMREGEALEFIGVCKDKAVLEACFAAFDNGKDKRLVIKEALRARAVELSTPPSGDAPSGDAPSGDGADGVNTFGPEGDESDST